MGIGVCRRSLLEVEGIEGVKGYGGIVLAGWRRQEIVAASDGSGLRGALGLKASAVGLG